MELDQLREAYRSTWLEWARQTNALQQIVETQNPASAQMEKLLFAVESARASHNEARDRLAAVLGHTPEPVDSAVPADGRVRTTARLLWEIAGRPAGTADSDWKRASAMVDLNRVGSNRVEPNRARTASA